MARNFTDIPKEYKKHRCYSRNGSPFYIKHDTFIKGNITEELEIRNKSKESVEAECLFKSKRESDTPLGEELIAQDAEICKQDVEENYTDDILYDKVVMKSNIEQDFHRSKENVKIQEEVGLKRYDIEDSEDILWDEEISSIQVEDALERELEKEEGIPLEYELVETEKISKEKQGDPIIDNTERAECEDLIIKDENTKEKLNEKHNMQNYEVYDLGSNRDKETFSEVETKIRFESEVESKNEENTLEMYESETKASSSEYDCEKDETIEEEINEELSSSSEARDSEEISWETFSEVETDIRFEFNGDLQKFESEVEPTDEENTAEMYESETKASSSEYDCENYETMEEEINEELSEEEEERDIEEISWEAEISFRSVQFEDVLKREWEKEEKITLEYELVETEKISNEKEGDPIIESTERVEGEYLIIKDENTKKTVKDKNNMQNYGVYDLGSNVDKETFSKVDTEIQLNIKGDLQIFESEIESKDEENKAEMYESETKASSSKFDCDKDETREKLINEELSEEEEEQRDSEEILWEAEISFRSFQFEDALESELGKEEEITLDYELVETEKILNDKEGEQIIHSTDRAEGEYLIIEDDYTKETVNDQHNMQNYEVYDLGSNKETFLEVETKIQFNFQGEFHKFEGEVESKNEENTAEMHESESKDSSSESDCEKDETLEEEMHEQLSEEEEERDSEETLWEAEISVRSVQFEDALERELEKEEEITLDYELVETGKISNDKEGEPIIESTERAEGESLIIKDENTKEKVNEKHNMQNYEVYDVGSNVDKETFSEVEKEIQFDFKGELKIFEGKVESKDEENTEEMDESQTKASSSESDCEKDESIEEEMNEELSEEEEERVSELESTAKVELIITNNDKEKPKYFDLEMTQCESNSSNAKAEIKIESEIEIEQSKSEQRRTKKGLKKSINEVQGVTRFSLMLEIGGNGNENETTEVDSVRNEEGSVTTEVDGTSKLDGTIDRMQQFICIVQKETEHMQEKTIETELAENKISIFFIGSKADFEVVLELEKSGEDTNTNKAGETESKKPFPADIITKNYNQIRKIEKEMTVISELEIICEEEKISTLTDLSETKDPGMKEIELAKYIQMEDALISKEILGIQVEKQDVEVNNQDILNKGLSFEVDNTSNVVEASEASITDDEERMSKVFRRKNLEHDLPWTERVLEAENREETEERVPIRTAKLERECVSEVSEGIAGAEEDNNILSMVSHQLPFLYTSLDHPYYMTSMTAHQDITIAEDYADTHIENANYLVNLNNHQIANNKTKKDNPTHLNNMQNKVDVIIDGESETKRIKENKTEQTEYFDRRQGAVVMKETGVRNERIGELETRTEENFAKGDSLALWKLEVEMKGKVDKKKEAFRSQTAEKVARAQKRTEEIFAEVEGLAVWKLEVERRAEVNKKKEVFRSETAERVVRAQKKTEEIFAEVEGLAVWKSEVERRAEVSKKKEVFRSETAERVARAQKKTEEIFTEVEGLAVWKSEVERRAEISKKKEAFISQTAERVSRAQKRTEKIFAEVEDLAVWKLEVERRAEVNKKKEAFISETAKRVARAQKKTEEIFTEVEGLAVWKLEVERRAKVNKKKEAFISQTAERVSRAQKRTEEIFAEVEGLAVWKLEVERRAEVNKKKDAFISETAERVARAQKRTEEIFAEVEGLAVWKSEVERRAEVNTKKEAFRLQTAERVARAHNRTEEIFDEVEGLGVWKLEFERRAEIIKKVDSNKVEIAERVANSQQRTEDMFTEVKDLEKRKKTSFAEIKETKDEKLETMKYEKMIQTVKNINDKINIIIKETEKEGSVNIHDEVVRESSEFAANEQASSYGERKQGIKTFLKDSTPSGKDSRSIKEALIDTGTKQDHLSKDVTEIFPGVHTASLLTSSDNYISQHKIQTVIEVSTEHHDIEAADVISIKPHKDDEALDNSFDQIADSISSVKRKGETILVCCEESPGNAATLCLSYPVKYEGLSVERASTEVEKRRPNIRLSSSILNKLKLWERRIRREQVSQETFQQVIALLPILSVVWFLCVVMKFFQDEIQCQHEEEKKSTGYQYFDVLQWP